MNTGELVYTTIEGRRTTAARASLKLHSSRYFHHFHTQIITIMTIHKNDNFLQIVLEKLQHILHRPTRSLSKEPASSSKKAKLEAVVGVRKTTFKDTVQVLDNKGVESEVVQIMSITV